MSQWWVTGGANSSGHRGGTCFQAQGQRRQLRHKGHKGMRSECVDLLDTDEYAMARAVVREAGTPSVVASMAQPCFGSVVDADSGKWHPDCPAPTAGAAGIDVDAVGVLTISQGELVTCLTQLNAVPIDLATRHSDFDEDAPLESGRSGMAPAGAVEADRSSVASGRWSPAAR